MALPSCGRCTPMSDIGTDDVSRDVNEFLKVMLQLYVMYAAHARAKGQREAEARLKTIERQIKEAREERLREAREFKRMDPRNKELMRTCELGREAYFTAHPVRTTPPLVVTKPAREPLSWDSRERRDMLASHLSRVVSPEVAQVRMLHDLACGKPAIAAVDRRPEAGVRRAAQARDRDGRERNGIERTVW